MIVEDQKVEVRWSRKNKTFLVFKGYEFTKMGNSVHVKKEDNPDINDLLYIKTSCKCCNLLFDKKISEFKHHGFHCCSRSCLAKIRMVENNPNPKKAKIKVQCLICEEEVEVFESVYKKNKWHFCSRDCYATHRKVNMIGENNPSYKGLLANCDTCGEEFTTVQSTIDRNHNLFCSTNCYGKFRSLNYSGENHNQFGVKKSLEQIDKMRQSTARRIANGEFPQTDTSIQVIVRNLLKDFDKSFYEEVPFKYYVLDFYSKDKNLAIEVMGDYWHANPLKYKEYGDLHAIQKKDIKRDKSKGTYLRKYYDIDVLYLWESDINKKTDLCVKLIELYIEKDGYLEDYNSFNYELINGSLNIKSDINLPFFRRANTIYQSITK